MESTVLLGMSSRFKFLCVLDSSFLRLAPLVWFSEGTGVICPLYKILVHGVFLPRWQDSAGMLDSFPEFCLHGTSRPDTQLGAQEFAFPLLLVISYLLGSSPPWIQGNSKGRRSWRGKLTYLEI